MEVGKNGSIDRVFGPLLISVDRRVRLISIIHKNHERQDAPPPRPRNHWILNRIIRYNTAKLSAAEETSP